MFLPLLVDGFWVSLSAQSSTSLSLSLSLDDELSSSNNEYLKGLKTRCTFVVVRPLPLATKSLPWLLVNRFELEFASPSL